MKTTNNVQKAILKSLAVIVSLVLISFTVNAQGFWESLLENNTFNEIALAMVETSSVIETTTEAESEMDAETFAFLLEEVVEEELELEDWMTNDANFNATFALEVEIEEPLEVEDWMTNESFFTTTTAVETESDNQVKSDKIKVDLKRTDAIPTNGEVVVKGDYIIGKNFIYLNVDEKERELHLEPWMVNKKVWKN